MSSQFHLTEEQMSKLQSESKDISEFGILVQNSIIDNVFSKTMVELPLNGFYYQYLVGIDKQKNVEGVHLDITPNHPGYRRAIFKLFEDCFTKDIFIDRLNLVEQDPGSYLLTGIASFTSMNGSPVFIRHSPTFITLISDPEDLRAIARIPDGEDLYEFLDLLLTRKD